MRMRSTRAYLLAVVLMPLLTAAVLTGQELEVAWDDYLNADARLAIAMDREQELQGQQNRLQAEIRELQEDRAWYNGWIVEYRLSQKSAKQLELADSLLQVKGRIGNMRRRMESTFQVLKQVYEDLLLADNVGESFTTSEKEQAVVLGQSLLSRSESPLDLPDYSAILAEQYENEELRDMVFSDLQIVLRTKLAAIDALLAEKEQEITLLNRLNEFHRDLSLQIESDRDVRGGSGLDRAYSKEAEDLGEDHGAATFVDNEETGAGRYAEIEDQDYMGTVRRNISESEIEDISLNPDPLYNELRRLSRISQQYQNLLQRLETELPD